MTTTREQSEKSKQHDHIASSIEVESRCSVECAICGDEAEENGTTAYTMSRYLHEDGWRWGVSEKFKLAGVMCPSCFAKPDAERGEG